MTAHLRRATVVLILVLAATSCGQTPPIVEIPPTTCGPDRLIVLIHGTGSTGSFDPNDLVVDGVQPHPSVLSSEPQREFDALLAGLDLCQKVTFSYDDCYLTPSLACTGDAGVNAWNLPTSPWNRYPPELAEKLDRLLRDIRPSGSAVKVTLVAFSAGGAVATYWAATRSEQLAAFGVDRIAVLDGIVSGHSSPVIEVACFLVGTGLLNHDFFGLGYPPCHFHFSSEYTTTVRASHFWERAGFRLGTLRANGDMIVWHRAAGLNLDPMPNTIEDPDIGAYWSCTSEEFSQASWGAKFGCAMRHGSVLKDTAAKAAFHRLLP